jgi:hypothetical protein
MIEIESKTMVPLTPRLLAESFWHMDDTQQAEFFHELHAIVSATPEEHGLAPYGLGEMQWCYMGRRIKEYSKEAREMFMAFSAFAYDYWPRKVKL